MYNAVRALRDNYTKINSGRRREEKNAFIISPEAEFVRMLSYSLTRDTREKTI